MLAISRDERNYPTFWVDHVASGPEYIDKLKYYIEESFFIVPFYLN
jgi:hypothetical protein